MTAITQAVAVLEGLAGKTLTNAQMLGAVKNYINYRDAQALTNEQIADAFVTSLVEVVRRQIRAGATAKAVEENLAVVQAASNASIVDL